METLMDEFCGYVHNYFLAKGGIHKGTFNISDGVIDADFLISGQYFRILGSILNDGVYKYPCNDLLDEEFEGEVWAMAVPSAVTALLIDIEAWNEKYGGVDSENYSPFVSESFNNYSYSKGSRSSGSSSSSSGTPITWKDVFASQLRRWRRTSDVI